MARSSEVIAPTSKDSTAGRPSGPAPSSLTAKLRDREHKYNHRRPPFSPRWQDSGRAKGTA